MTPRLLLVLLLVLDLGCTAAGADAVIGTAIAATAAGVRRSNGECYTPCTPGNVCNPQSGMCDPIPCRGECRSGEQCEQSPLGERCVPAAVTTALEVRRDPGPAPMVTPPPPDAGLPGGPPTRLILPR
ncbi:MAG: hypothetical protein Q8S33_33460 [Myxococcales bacterium]|nr:hypothetical protein [Myxococcales bacterium]MDP3505295.1 hypothetical protein [Myxococcales bacterium]